MKRFEAEFDKNFEKLRGGQEDVRPRLISLLDNAMRHRVSKLNYKEGEIQLFQEAFLGLGLWVDRFCVLNERKLSVFEKEGDKVPVLVFNFDLFRSDIKVINTL